MMSRVEPPRRGDATHSSSTATPRPVGWRGRLHRVLPGLLGIALAACGGVEEYPQTMYAPRSDFAENVLALQNLTLYLGTAVGIVTFAILAYILVRFRHRPGAPEPKQVHGNTTLELTWTLIPAVLIAIIAVPTARTIFETYRMPENALVVEVRGYQWWWRYAYALPNGDTVVTANEIHVPVGQPVILKMTSADVIHSFWVPQLHGKIEMVPGWTNVIHLEADEPGIYFGKCAEFCGVQHANMEFLVIAQEEDDFQGWLEQQRSSAAQPEDDLTRKGQQVFLGSACVYCHTIRGTNASGRLGPDLTHLASRRTIGARMLENNHGNLAGWTVNSQAIKPGNHMPPMQLEPESLQALLVYLESLE